MIFKYDGKAKQWKYGIYTEKEDVDLSTIATKRGGGGHRSAAGFSTEDLLPELKKIMIK